MLKSGKKVLTNRFSKFGKNENRKMLQIII